MKYVALLRGIAPTNPNMRNEKLRRVFEELGFKNVHTVISSGNVIFESNSKNSKTLEEKIEKAFPKKLGFKSTTIIRSQDELQKLSVKNPFGKLEHSQKSSLNVTFLKNNFKTDIEFPLQIENRSYKLLGTGDQAVFSIIDLTSSKTPDLMIWLEKKFGKAITTRTWNSVGKILKRMTDN